MKKFWVDGPVVTTNLVDHVLTSRSISDRDLFFNPLWPDHLHDPSLLPDSESAVKRVWQAIRSKEKVGVIGDYDMDGTPGAALLSQFFGLFDITPIIILPTREEGYGFQPSFVDRLKKQDVSLIITVDCGIRDFAAVEHAKNQGIDTIIIDHHECGTTLPAAIAIVNPKRLDSNYPFRELCGTAVAYKLLHAVAKDSSNLIADKMYNWLAWSLDLVALATLGDMVPLVDENRLIAHYGLKVIRNGRRLGLQRFVAALGFTVSQIAYGDICYKIIPKLNASGRLETMDDVFLLLTSSNPDAIDMAIKRILTRDTQRQLLSKSIYAQAKQSVSADDLPAVIILADKSWHPGVTGLVASRLCEEYGRPVGVLGSLDGVNFRGSMRSNKGVSLPPLLDQARDVLQKYGGHNEAAGLSLSADQMDHFKQLMRNIKLKTDEVILTTDGSISPQQADMTALDQLSQCLPWGIGNTEPQWSICGVKIDSVRWIGEGGQHLKAVVTKGPASLDIIYFGASQYQDFDFSQTIDVYGTLEVNEFRGARRPQLMVRGIASSQ